MFKTNDDKYKKWEKSNSSYEKKWRERVIKKQEAAMKEQENRDRLAAKAQKQREAEANAEANVPKKPPPNTPPVIQRRREMLTRMGLAIDNPVEIKKAWKRLVLQYHPDKCGGQDTKFKSILEAYEFLLR
jgi:hypothetical protein